MRSRHCPPADPTGKVTARVPVVGPMLRPFDSPSTVRSLVRPSSRRARRISRRPTVASFASFALVAAVQLACSATVRQPPGAPPTRASITREHPGGDAEDPHRAALERLLGIGWGHRSDKDDQLLVPLHDVRHWKRVRFWLLDHFTGFRYGTDYHGLSVVLVRDLGGREVVDSARCMREAEAWARPQLNAYGVRLGAIARHRVAWQEHRVLVHETDAVVDYGLGPSEFSAAWAAYPAYVDACLIFAFAVPWRSHPELAQRVVRRWIEEAVPRISPRTQKRPYRQ